MTTPNQSASGGQTLLAIVILFAGLGFILLALFIALPPPAPVAVAVRPTATLEVTALPPTVEPTEAAAPVDGASQGEAVAVALDSARVARGEQTYQTVCSACHGFNAKGISGIGKTLIGSPFINDMNDADLVNFLKVGRDVSDPLNTTGIPMPARGGSGGLSDDDLLNVVQYIRSLNQNIVAAVPTIAPTVDPDATEEPAAVFVPLDLSALSAPTAISQGAVAEATVEASVEATTEVMVEPTNTPAAASGGLGQSLYLQACAGCHGDQGEGVLMIAKPLSESQLFTSRDGTGLLQFLNTTQPIEGSVMPHPARGGAYNLNDADLLAIIGYLLTLPSS